MNTKTQTIESPGKQPSTEPHPRKRRARKARKRNKNQTYVHLSFLRIKENPLYYPTCPVTLYLSPAFSNPTIVLARIIFWNNTKRNKEKINDQRVWTQTITTYLTTHKNGREMRFLAKWFLYWNNQADAFNTVLKWQKTRVRNTDIRSKNNEKITSSHRMYFGYVKNTKNQNTS